MVILYGLPLDTEKSNVIRADEVEKLTEDVMVLQIPKEVILLCVSYKPDKRCRFYKWLDKLNKENPIQKIVKSFSPLSDRGLYTFVEKESNDLNLTPECINTLIHKVWVDQFRLFSEIEKLRYWKEYYNEEITQKIVDEVCFWIIEEDVFHLLDLILNDSKSAINFVQKLEDDGIDWNALNWSFMWWIRNYLLVLDYAERWIMNSKEIAVELKQNPWVIWNIVKKLPQIRKKEGEIKKLFKNIVNIDYEIKNGNSQPENYFFTIKKMLLNN